MSRAHERDMSCASVIRHAHPRLEHSLSAELPKGKS